MIGERMASKAMINKTMIDRIEMKQKLMQWRSALVLVTMLLMLPLQMLAAELGEAGKRLAALPGVSDVEALESTTFPEKYVFFTSNSLTARTPRRVLSSSAWCSATGASTVPPCS